MAANNSNVSDGEPSRLLALPVELLQRITDNVSDEALTTFRLTCKTIEAATFDHFAKVFFEERYCCIYDKPRWTLLRDVVSSRMGDRICRVVFTTDILAPTTWDHLQLAPAKPEEGEERYPDFLMAQCDLADALAEAVGARKHTVAWPSKDVVEHCLTRMRNHAPNICVEADLFEEDVFRVEGERTSVKANLLVAIVASGMRLSAFKTPSHDIVEVNETLERLGYSLSSCISSVQIFSLKEIYENQDSRRLIRGCLESATELRTLKIHFYDFAEPSLDTPASKLLSVSDVSRLEVLSLENMTVQGADLITVLSCCKPTLLKVTMGCVCVLGNETVWLKVFDILASAPRLSKVRLRWLQQTIDDVTGSDYDPDKIDSCSWMEKEGRERLTAKLDKLLAVMPRVVN